MLVRRMAGARGSFAALVFAVVFAGSVATAEERAPPTSGRPSNSAAVTVPVPALGNGLALSAQVPKELSADCRVHLKTFEGKRPFKACRKALRERRTIKVLAIGTSSTSGLGASPAGNYAVRLEEDLENFLKGIDVDVVARAVSGEVGSAASDRMRLAVADLKPDLVVWQVGTTDALARVGAGEFRDALRDTVRWLIKNKIDVVLIDPQFVERLANDENYLKIVKAIATVGKEEQVFVVHRYDAMSDLAKQHGPANLLPKDGFQLNDLGYRCVAEYAARAIVAGILEADNEAAGGQKSNAPGGPQPGVQN